MTYNLTDYIKWHFRTIARLTQYQPNIKRQNDICNRLSKWRTTTCLTQWRLWSYVSSGAMPSYTFTHQIIHLLFRIWPSWSSDSCRLRDMYEIKAWRYASILAELPVAFFARQLTRGCQTAKEISNQRTNAHIRVVELDTGYRICFLNASTAPNTFHCLPQC